MNRRAFFRVTGLVGIGGLLGGHVEVAEVVRVVPRVRRGEGISVGDVWKVEGTGETVLVLAVHNDGVTTRYDMIRNYYS